MLWAEYQSFKNHNIVRTVIFRWKIASISPYPSHNGAKGLYLSANLQHGATGPCSWKPHRDLPETLRLWSYLVILWGVVLRSTRDIRWGFSHQWRVWHQVLHKNIFRRQIICWGGIWRWKYTVLLVQRASVSWALWVPRVRVSSIRNASALWLWILPQFILRLFRRNPHGLLCRS